MNKKIQKICDCLKKESDKKAYYFNEDLKKKYKAFKNWLLENGAIFDNYIDFPIRYSYFSKIGCKSKENINENESFLLIPKDLIVSSRDLYYLDKYIFNIKEEISDKDLPSIYLTLNLYLEKKDKNSFFKPYIDIIFLEEEMLYDKLTKENLIQLEDDITIKSIEKMFDKLNDIYELIIQCNKFSEMKKEEFHECYFKVMARKIEFNNYCAMIPLLDLFYYDNSINIKYEIYDSENMMFKYTSLLNTNIKNNLYMTKSKYLPINKPSYNKLIPFIVDYQDNEKEEEEKNIIKFNKNDYFSVAISKNNKIVKNDILCTNNTLCNKKLLKYKGYCLLYNKNDYLTIKINFKRGDILIDRYLKEIFLKNYELENDDPIYNDIKIKIYFNYISTDLLKYFRFFYFYEKNNAKEYFKYKFNLDIELKIINSSITYLEDKLKIMEKNYSFENDLKDLEKLIFNNKEKNSLKVNIFIFRLSQKIILKNQIDLLNYIMNIMKKYKVDSYNIIYDYIKKEKIPSEYDSEENTKLKILRFIAYMSQYIDLKNK